MNRLKWNLYYISYFLLGLLIVYPDVPAYIIISFFTILPALIVYDKNDNSLQYRFLLLQTMVILTNVVFFYFADINHPILVKLFNKQEISQSIYLKNKVDWRKNYFYRFLNEDQKSLIQKDFQRKQILQDEASLKYYIAREKSLIKHRDKMIKEKESYIEKVNKDIVTSQQNIKKLKKD